MYKYIKRIIGLFLFIVITGSNCNDKETKSTNSPVKVTLDQLAAKLQDGPIFIGENHGKPYARQAIAALINKGCVKKLFLELPDLVSDVKSPDPSDKLVEDKKMAQYLSTVNRTFAKDIESLMMMSINFWTKAHRNSFSMSDLIKLALSKQSISIYWHDAPQTDRGRLISLQGVFITQADSDPNTLARAITARNEYSATIIGPHLSDNNGKGVVILAGQDHLNSMKVVDDKTLQVLLGINDDRVFDLSEEEVQS